MALIDKAHANLIAPRRLQQLSAHIAKLLPAHARVLDVGCGDGHLTKLMATARPDVALTGVEVYVRQTLYWPVQTFDGKRLPFADAAFDDGLLVDVLHHADDPVALLREARRVCKRSLIIKDHLREGPLAFATLALMDLAGNPSQGVTMKRDYWRKQRWLDLFQAENWPIEVWTEQLRLYGRPIDWVCGRGLHFICQLGENP